MSPAWARRIISSLAAVLVSSVAPAAPSGGGGWSVAHAQAPEEPSFRTSLGQPPGDGFFIDLRAGFDEATAYLSNFDFAADWIYMSFRHDNVVFNADGMRLLAEKPVEEAAPYTSGEFQRRGFYGYGRYEVVMRSSDAPGTVSSFFTHTDSQFGDPHTEIDFEFIGRSPRKVHLNYYVEGKNNPADVELWFDASKAEHLYAFEWAPESIRWYVDGVKVREVTSEISPIGIPANSSRVIANIWTGNRTSEEWVGTPTFDRASAFYTCMSHVPAGQTGKQCSDGFARSEN